MCANHKNRSVFWLLVLKRLVSLVYIYGQFRVMLVNDTLQAGSDLV
jgi:hypothetical protein